VPNNYENLKDTILTVKIIPGRASDPEAVKIVKWEIVGMKIKLKKYRDEKD